MSLTHISQAISAEKGLWFHWAELQEGVERNSMKLCELKFLRIQCDEWCIYLRWGSEVWSMQLSNLIARLFLNLAFILLQRKSLEFEMEENLPSYPTYFFHQIEFSQGDFLNWVFRVKPQWNQQSQFGNENSFISLKGDPGLKDSF